MINNNFLDYYKYYYLEPKKGNCSICNNYKTLCSRYEFRGTEWVKSPLKQNLNCCDCWIKKEKED
jgi:hypothetical protein